MCCKHITQPFKFFCYTDESVDLNVNVNIIPFIDHELEVIVHNKLFLFSPEVDYHLCDGPRVYFDLDLLIRKNIDHIVNNNRGDLSLIRSAWRKEHKRGLPMLHHMFNSSCMTWKSPHTRKIWDHFIKDPEYFTIKYHWGMDSFLSYEQENMGIDIHFFPEREFMSLIHGGVDYHEQDYYMRHYQMNHVKARPEIFEKVSIMLLNGDVTQIHYKHHKQFYLD